MGDSSDDEQEYGNGQSDSGGAGKDLVHKSISDPGKIVSNRGQVLATRPPRHPTSILPSGPATRKCVLTLDGYSYVIGKELNKFYFFFLQLKVKLDFSLRNLLKTFY